MITNFFETKEQYANFRAAWKSAVNNPRSKSTLAPHDECMWDYTKRKSIVTKGTGQHRVAGWIRPEHHILFNIIRGKAAATGFTPITNICKISSNCGLPNIAYINAVTSLKGCQRAACIITGKVEDYEQFSKYSEKFKAKIRTSAVMKVNNFLEPFAGSITIDQFVDFDLSIIE